MINQNIHHFSSTDTQIFFSIYHPYIPYPLANLHNYGKSPFSMGKLTINGHFQ